MASVHQCNQNAKIIQILCTLFNQLFVQIYADGNEIKNQKKKPKYIYDLIQTV